MESGFLDNKKNSALEEGKTKEKAELKARRRHRFIRIKSGVNSITQIEGGTTEES